jgi:hypothetical protein
MKLYTRSDITVRNWLITFEPINTPAVTRRIFGSVRQLKSRAVEAGREVARQLGVSPLSLAVTVREAV